MAGDGGPARLDYPLPFLALLPVVLLQLLEPGREPASASTCDAGKLSAPGNHAALPDRDSPLHADRVLGGVALARDRLSTSVFSGFSGGQVPADAVPGGDHPTLDQLPGAGLCLEGHFRQ